MMIVKIADPVVVMMNQSAPKEDGAGAPTAGKRPARTAQTAAPRNDRPEKIEDGETEACPQPSRGDKNALPMTPTVAQAVPGSMGAMERNLQTVEVPKVQGGGGASRKLYQQRAHEDSTRSFSQGGFEDPWSPRVWELEPELLCWREKPLDLRRPQRRLHMVPPSRDGSRCYSAKKKMTPSEKS